SVGGGPSNQYGFCRRVTTAIANAGSGFGRARRARDRPVPPAAGDAPRRQRTRCRSRGAVHPRRVASALKTPQHFFAIALLIATSGTTRGMGLRGCAERAETRS